MSARPTLHLRQPGIHATSGRPNPKANTAWRPRKVWCGQCKAVVAEPMTRRCLFGHCDAARELEHHDAR